MCVLIWSLKKMLNTLIVIGWRTSKHCYLNTTKQEAIERYASSEKEYPTEDMIKVVEFEDEFQAYDVWWCQ